MTHHVDPVAGAATAVLYGLLCAAAYYLASRAVITSWLWKRYPAWLDHYTLCAACSGFLYGAVTAATIGRYFDLPFLVLPGRHPATPVVAGLCAIAFTPWFASKLLAALETTSPLAPEPARGDPDDPDVEAEERALAAEGDHHG